MKNQSGIRYFPAHDLRFLNGFSPINPTFPVILAVSVIGAFLFIEIAGAMQGGVARHDTTGLWREKIEI